MKTFSETNSGALEKLRLAHLERALTAQEIPNGMQENPNGSLQQSESAKKSNKGFSELEVRQLTQALGLVCVMQKTYGKNATELKTLVKGFCWLLDGYPMPQILGALKTYVLKHNDIPAPSDLEAIINPPKEPLSAAMYTSLKKKVQDEGYFLSSREREFLREFEEQEYGKMQGYKALDHKNHDATLEEKQIKNQPAPQYDDEHREKMAQMFADLTKQLGEN